MNLTDMDDADAKRLVDFAAGLVFGLHGHDRAGHPKVFLLSPAHVEVAAEEARGAQGRPRLLQPELTRAPSAPRSPFPG